MERESGFFRLLWRFNAIAIAVVGLVGIVSAGVLAITVLLPRQRALDVPPPFVATQKTKSTTVTYSLGDHSKLDGTPYVLVELKRTTLIDGQDLRLCSGSCRDSDDSTVNYLLVDGRDAASHWMLHGLDHFVWQQELRATPPVSDTSHEAVTGIVIGSVPSVPDEHGEPRRGATETLYYLPLGDSKPTKFFSADEIKFVEQVDRDTISVLYRNGASTASVSFAISTLKKLGEAPIPKVQ